jgi:hypothetical protein
MNSESSQLTLTRTSKSARRASELVRPVTIPRTCGAFRLFNKAGTEWLIGHPLAAYLLHLV